MRSHLYYLLYAACSLSRQVYAAPGPDCSTRIDRGNIVSCVQAGSLAVRIEQSQTDALRGRQQSSASWLPSNPVVALSGARRTQGTQGPEALNWSVSLAQELEIGGQRQSRVRATDATLRAQIKRQELRARDAVVEGVSSYFELLASRAQHELAVRLHDAGSKVAIAVRARAEAGIASSLDADLAEASALRLMQSALASAERVSESEAQLDRLLGASSASTPRVINGDLQPLIAGGVFENAPASISPVRAELQLVDAEHTAALSRAEALRRARLPNPSLSAFVQNDGFNELVLGMGIAFPLTLPAPIARSYAGEVAEADAVTQQAKLEREQAARDIRQRLRAARAAYTAHSQALATLTPERTRRAEKSLADLRAEVAAGRIGVRDALAAQQALVELLQGAIEERRALCVASLELARAMGMPLEGILK